MIEDWWSKFECKKASKGIQTEETNERENQNQQSFEIS